MKKNLRFGRLRAFFLPIIVLSVIALSCKENDADIIKPKTITDVILENEQFSILKDIMLYTQQSDALRGENLTFFAPDNDAFQRANIFSSTVITGMPKDSARAFLHNHLVKPRTEYANIKAGTLETINKRRLTITRPDSVVHVNGAEVVIENINADNGVIHVIDSVFVRR